MKQSFDPIWHRAIIPLCKENVEMIRAKKTQWIKEVMVRSLLEKKRIANFNHFLKNPLCEVI
jgi:hypothetical protein